MIELHKPSEICADRVEIEFCNELTLYCRLETVERSESICNCKSDDCVLEDRYVKPIMERVATIEEICNIRFFRYKAYFLL